MSDVKQKAGLLGIVRRAAGFRESTILAVVAAACLGLSLKSPTFLTPASLSATLLATSTVSIVAIGMTMLIVSGGFDLSVGSVMALCGAVTALCLSRGMPLMLAILAGLGLGAAIGLVNGAVVAYVRISPFVTTLAMMSIARGALLVLTGASEISGLPDGFKAIGQGAMHGIQNPILISITLVLLGDIVLRKSRFFRQNYYLGGNERAAILSGINANRMKLFNYVLTSVLAALAGIVYTARMGSASTSAGNGLELQVISAVIIGGASLAGGEGTVLGSYLGALLMSIIVSALTLLDLGNNWNPVVIGAVLLLAVVADTLARRRR